MIEAGGKLGVNFYPQETEVYTAVTRGEGSRVFAEKRKKMRGERI